MHAQWNSPWTSHTTRRGCKCLHNERNFQNMRTTRWGPGMPNRKQISRLRSAACELAFPLSGSFGMAVLFQFPNVAGCSHAVEGGKSTTKPCTWLALNEKKIWHPIYNSCGLRMAVSCCAAQPKSNAFLSFFFFLWTKLACLLSHIACREPIMVVDQRIRWNKREQTAHEIQNNGLCWDSEHDDGILP